MNNEKITGEFGHQQLRNGYPYLPKSQRKKILLLSDDLQLRTTSGIATMSKEFVLGTCHYYNWFQVGGAMNHPEKGKLIDINSSVTQETGVPDPDVKIMPVDGYGTQQLIREIIQIEKPDGILFYTDPRQFVWLFEMENEIRQHIPMMYYAIWDDIPVPYYNESYYESCDLIMSISKQSHNIHKMCVGEGNYIEI